MTMHDSRGPMRGRRGTFHCHLHGFGKCELADVNDPPSRARETRTWRHYEASGDE